MEEETKDVITDPELINELLQDVDETQKALDAFFENRISDCTNILNDKKESSLHHGLGASAATFIYSVLTFERTDMDKAMETIRKSIEVANKKRRTTSLREYVFGLTDFSQYKEEEIHAELVYAENHIMLGFLTFAQDQSIFALLKAAYRIKVGNDTYNTCQQILNQRTKWPNSELEKHFKSGCYTGIGTSNLILSHLPARMIKVFRWVGFSGDRQMANSYLKMAAEIKDGLRYKVVALITISFNLYLEQYYGLGKGDMEWSRDLLASLREQFPDGVMILAFLGRLHQLKGNTELAIESFHKAIAVPIEWKQVHNICYWELTWCYAMKQDWAEAAKTVNILRQQSNWSKCIMNQIYASLLYMQMELNGKVDLREEIDKEMNEIPSLRRRIGGKTVPVEKLAIHMSIKYFRDDDHLTLPIYEIFYFYNIFSHTGGRPELIDPILHNIENMLDRKNLETDNIDQFALLLLLKGTCLRYKKSFQEASDCFYKIIEVEDKIKKDTYIPPHAALELGVLYVEMDNLDEAKVWLEKSRSEYKGFLVEAMVHLRVHSAFREITDREEAAAAATVTKDHSNGTSNSNGNEVEVNPSGGGSPTRKKPTLGSWIRSFSFN